LRHSTSAIGAAAANVSLKRIWLMVAIALAGCIVATVMLQSFGLAPAMKVADAAVTLMGAPS
jgi:hypothetical protein